MSDVVDDPLAGDAEPEVVRTRKRSGARDTIEWVAIVAGALLVAVLVKTFLIQAFFIPSLSMYPTLHKGDRVLVNKISYHVHDIHRGDIVVFARPPGAASDGIKDLIKRVVGLPGDTVESRDGAVYVNDHPLKEPYINTGNVTVNMNRQTVPSHHLFVMGDNREDSTDSRVFGAIDDDLVVGRAFIIVWPFSGWQLL